MSNGRGKVPCLQLADALAANKRSQEGSSSIESLGIENTKIEAAPGAELDSHQKVIVGNVLDARLLKPETKRPEIPTQKLEQQLFTGEPSLERLSLRKVQ